MLNYCLLIQTVRLMKSKNIYEDFFKWKDLCDFSKFFDDANKNVIGKMKDEYGAVIIDEFVGLK